MSGLLCIHTELPIYPPSLASRASTALRATETSNDERRRSKERTSQNQQDPGEMPVSFGLRIFGFLLRSTFDVRSSTFYSAPLPTAGKPPAFAKATAGPP
jgi:hypothetical protein